MKKVSFEKTLSIKVDVASVSLGCGYSAFERIIKTDFGFCKEKTETGICSDSELELLSSDILNDAQQIIEKDFVFLVRKEFVEKYKENPDTAIRDIKLYYPSTCSYLQGIEQHLNEFVLLKYDFEKELFLDLASDKYVPKRIYFVGTDVLRASEFDLDACRKILSSRQDVSFEDDQDENISFSFKPDTETYQQYVNLSYFDRKDFIIDNVLKLQRKENV